MINKPTSSLIEVWRTAGPAVRIFIAVAVVGLFLGLTYFIFATGHSPFSRQTPPVAIFLRGLGGGSQLSIPVDYMQWDVDRKGGEGWEVTLLVAYPSMAPYATLSEDRRKKIEKLDPSAPDQQHSMVIHVRGSGPGAVQSILQRTIARHTTTDRGESEGFRVYQENIGSVVYDYFVPSEDADTGPRYFKCSTQMCMASAQYSDRLGVGYQIPRAQLKNWRRIDQDVMNLVGSLLVACFEDSVTSTQPPRQTHQCAPKKP